MLGFKQYITEAFGSPTVKHNATPNDIKGIAMRSTTKLARFVVEETKDGKDGYRLHGGDAEFFQHGDISPDPDKTYSHITGFVKHTPRDKKSPFKFQYESNHADENHPSLKGLGDYHPFGDFWDDIKGTMA